MEKRKLSELRVHPLLERSPMLAEGHPDCVAIRESLERHGWLESVVVVESGDRGQETGDRQAGRLHHELLVVDGRHRVRAAAQLARADHEAHAKEADYQSPWDDVPVRIVEDSEAVEVIRNSIRKTDSGHRYGGEEFTVILTETRGQDAGVAAERLRKRFADEIFFPVPLEPVQVTVSVGIANYRVGEEIASFVKRAVQNMYEAKAKGKNCVFFSD